VEHNIVSTASLIFTFTYNYIPRRTRRCSGCNKGVAAEEEYKIRRRMMRLSKWRRRMTITEKVTRNIIG